MPNSIPTQPVSTAPSAYLDHPVSIHHPGVIINADTAASRDQRGREGGDDRGSRAVLYLRVSTQRQVNTDYNPEGISLPAQRAACERKAEQLGLSIVDEYVEPGKSATEMTRRVEFQRMLERIRRERDVDHVIVYELSRMARNRYDDAVVMADLRKRGVTLVSATENIDATPVGQLMHGLLAAFNEYRSAKDGADIVYKMGEKAKKGGTLGQAPLGYLNVIDRREGREIRAVELDTERAPLIRQAFELYAYEDYTLDELAAELGDRGLTTKPTAKSQAKQLSRSALARLLRNRYYLGYVTYKGADYAGRHDSLIDHDLFDRVQAVLDSRSGSGERRRVNRNYLVGSIFCGHCWDQRQQLKRMVIQRAVGRNGGEYFYFFCRGRQSKACDSPYSNFQRVEEAVPDHYKAIRFSPDFIALMREAVTSTLEDSLATTRLLQQQVDDQLRKLDTQERTCSIWPPTANSLKPRSAADCGTSMNSANDSTPSGKTPTNS